MKTLERLKQDGLLATEINKLESRLWRQTRRDELKTILITSAVRGEGKSTTAAYLSTTLGLYPGRRILALDFDFRIPTLNQHLGLDVRVGIDKVLSGEAKLTDALVKTELPGLHVGAPTTGGADPALLLRTHVLREMFRTLRDAFDLILLDTPAIIPVADATMLLPFADGVILAAMAGRTTGPQLSRARELCEGMDANILGLVVGNVEEAAPEYIAGDYDYSYYAATPTKRPRSEPDGGLSAPLKSYGPPRRRSLRRD
jgi:non-specific protein-tyrosine kinase